MSGEWVGVLRAGSQLLGGLALFLAGMHMVREAQFHADQEHQRFLGHLFSCESETDPVTVVILMHIANRLKSVADSAENVAECLERMVTHQ